MKAVVTILALCCAGCAQLVRLEGGAYYNPPSGHRLSNPYKATKTVAQDWFMAPAKTYGWWGMGTSDPIGTAWLTLTWPMCLVDLPCEFAVDTVMCPADWILQR